MTRTPLPTHGIPEEVTAKSALDVLRLAAILDLLALGAETCAVRGTMERALDGCAMLARAIAADLDAAAAVALESGRAR